VDMEAPPRSVELHHLQDNNIWVFHNNSSSSSNTVQSNFPCSKTKSNSKDILQYDKLLIVCLFVL